MNNQVDGQEEMPHSNSRIFKHYQIITEKAFNFLMENIIKPYLPKKHKNMKEYFIIIYWNGKKIFEIDYKELFIVTLQVNTKKTEIHKLRLTMLDDPYLMDKYELFGSGMNSYLAIFKNFFLSPEDNIKILESKNYEKVLSETIQKAQEDMKIYYLNRQIKLDNLMSIFVKKKVIIGKEIKFKNFNEDIENIFYNVNNKDILFFATNEDWETQEMPDEILNESFLDINCSFCEMEITNWRNDISPHCIEVEGEDKVIRLL